MKAASWLTETMQNPDEAKSGSPSKTAMNYALRTDKTFFEWLAAPNNVYKNKRFGISMNGSQDMSAPGAVLQGRKISINSKYKSLICLPFERV